MNLDGEPQIGQYRMVPCVKTWQRWSALPVGSWVPVMGPEHEDAEIINFPHQHWHIDWRFASGPLWQYVTTHRSLDAQLGGVHSIVITMGFALGGEATLRKMKMKREMPPHPSHTLRHKVPWMNALEEKFAKVRMKCRTCPHRGLPLGSVADAKGNFVCTGHGLTWNPQSGKLVRTDELHC